ncbi:F-box/kelch-repeat protein At3g23880-like [Quercus lobata]|uniref:F-box/kelch-repeat protein At3g23880-like n=1 Tax=Quercus lobata TaxID=97700 RepID=UPI0012492765|nr:F-box/kelch-repeat protein At3g23880-like [Quercus lobata]
MSDYLPDEVLLEILQRLSVKSLIQLRCVSKSWNSLITSSALINSHLARSLSLPSKSNNLIVRYRIDRPYVEHYKLIHDDNASFDQIQQLEIPVKCLHINHFILIGSINGLFSLYELDRFILWNPSIGKSITLPKPCIKTHDFGICYPAFGFDPRTNDYKVVRIVVQCVLMYKGPKQTLVEIYSLNEGSWRITSAGASYPLGISFNYWRRPAASLNGVVHFAANVKGSAFSPLVLSFDLGDEVFRMIPVPDSTFKEDDDVHTTVIAGSLTLLCHDPAMHTFNKHCSIWMMKEYGIVDSWTKLCTVDLNREIIRVLGLRKNGHIFVVAKLPCDWELSSYDLESQQVKKLGICGNPYFFHIDDYMENLVLLDKPNDAVSKRESE